MRWNEVPDFEKKQTWHNATRVWRLSSRTFHKKRISNCYRKIDHVQPYHQTYSLTAQTCLTLFNCFTSGCCHQSIRVQLHYSLCWKTLFLRDSNQEFSHCKWHTFTAFTWKKPSCWKHFLPSSDESVAAEKSHSWQKNLAPFTIPQVIAEFDSVVLSHQNSGERRHAVAGDGYVGDTSIAMYSRLS
jgi:hypothetical protein